MKISANKAIAAAQLFLGGMAAALFFGFLSFMLWCIAGGLGAVLIPILVYFGVRFAEKWRGRFRELHGINSAAFIGVAEFPSVIVSGVLFLLLMGNSKGGDLTDIAGDFIVGIAAMFCGGTALLIMLGTVICSIVTNNRKRPSRQTTEV